MPAAPDISRAIRILVADHRPLYEAALRLLLARSTGFDVLDPDGRDADILLLSGAAPHGGALALLHDLRQQHPAAKPVLLVHAATPSFVRSARAAGVRGLLFENTAPDELVRAIGIVRQGEHVFDPQLAVVNRATRVSLSDRETEVLKLAADGASPHDISRRLDISKSTTRTYLSGAIRKMGATNRFDAAQAARDLGWL